jgi:uncharacterized repeat protein (TIGR01451 family)
MIPLLAALMLILPSGSAVASEVKWLEDHSNPIYDPSHRAYYPCVLYDPSQFSGHGASYYYKMWYGGYTPGHFEAVTYSNDGINWSAPVEMQGIASGGYHAKIAYVPAGYGAGPYYYKMWYWDPSVSIYGITAMRTADSADGVNWANDQVLTQNPAAPLVTGVWPDWNRGTYGPVSVLYNPSAGNTGGNPFNYTFAMYYDGTTGGVEVIGLAYSADGNYWTRYGSGPVLGLGPPGSWDSDYVTNGTVIPDANGEWHMWYSGSDTGSGGPHDGIGYATSPDGINWTKDPYNPQLHISDGVAWRNLRTYTPSVLYSPTQFDGHGGSVVLKMWFTGVTDSGGSANYAIGYAERSNVIPVGPTRKYTTIQSAINAAFPGDILMVDPGTYNESLLVNKSLTIKAASGASDTIIDGSGLPGAGLPAFAGSLRALVAVVPPNASGSPYHIRLEGLTIRNSERFGLGANGNSRGTVRFELVDSVVTANAQDAVFLNDVDASGGNVSLVQGCTIEPSGGNTGLYIDGCDYLTVGGNTFSDLGGAGTWGLGGQQCTNLRVEENLFEGFDDLALILQASGAAHQPLDDIFIERNTFDGCATNIKLTQYENNGGYGDLSIRNNFFQGTYGTGISLDPNSLTSGSTAGVNIWNNSFGGATAFSVSNLYPSTVNAAGNWWGGSDPAYVGTQVSAGVDYSPWLATGTDVEPSNPGFQGDFSSLWVDESSPRIGTTGWLKEGINAVMAGGTVTAAPGTYNEWLIVDKAVTLQSSSGAASTVIDGLDAQPYVVQIQSSNVTIDGFTVTNPEYSGGSDASGIVLTESPSYSNLRITNNIVHDIGIPNRSPVVYGTVGVNLGQCHDVEVDHNEIYNIKHGFVDPVNNYWAQGISIWGMDSSNLVTNINVHDNYIHDVSSPNKQDSAVGIQGNVSGIVVRDNVMADTGEYGVDTWDAWGGAVGPTVVEGNDISGASIAGIKMVYPGANPITANALDACGTGILIAPGGGASSLRFNGFTDIALYGIDNQSGGQIDASWCYWGNVHGPSYDGISYGETFAGALAFRPYLDAPFGGTPPATPITVDTPSPLPGAVKGAPYAVDLAAGGGTAPYGWFVYSGSLPPGLTLSSSGVLSGTPGVAGTYSFALEAGDSQQADFKQFTLTVLTQPANLSFEKTVSPAGTVSRGEVLTYTLRVRNQGGEAASGARLSDAVPAYTGYVTGTTTLNGEAVPDIGGTTPLAQGMAVNSTGEAAGAIAPGEEAVVTFMVQVGSDLPLGASVRNVSTLTADGMDPQEASCISQSSSDLPSTWFFAEGSTQPRFDEYILLSNMGSEDMTATITYITEGGVEKSFDHPLPAHSRQTVYVNAEMPGQAGLAAIVNGQPGLICERSMYYQRQGISGGDDVIGANAPSVDLFFAEGYTGSAGSQFEEWILVLNPNPEAANFSIDYLFPGGMTVQKRYAVPARQRMSICVDSEIGEGREVSARLRSDRPLVAERSMYFVYNNVFPGGHTGKAATVTRNDWYLAEGYTGWSGSRFDEWILVSNQNDRPTPVTVTYMFPDGSTRDFEYTAAAYGRLTVSADADVGENQMISARVHSELPVVVERAMYFDYRNKWRGGHNCLGSPAPSSELYFAEGYTGSGGSQFETWVLVQNTSGEPKEVRLEYLLKSGEIFGQELTVNPHSRTTISANEVLRRSSLEFSIRVISKDGSPTLLAERAMYFNYQGPLGTAQGGHDVAGY